MNSDTLIIIIILASLGLLVFVFGLSKAYRSLSATSNPLPPVQPLAHHRQSYFQLNHYNKSDDELECILVDPQPPFHHQRPSSATPTPRPTSIASSSRLSHSPSLTGRIGLPHSPHSQMHVVLPAPLASSPDSLAAPDFRHVSPTPSTRRPTSRHFLDVSSEYDRRSMSLVDRWLPPPPTDSYSLSDTPPTQCRTPSPLIPPSPPRSRPTTLRSPSDSPSINIALDTANATISNTSITLPNQDHNPIPITSPITPVDNIPPLSSSSVPISQAAEV